MGFESIMDTIGTALSPVGNALSQLTATPENRMAMLNFGASLLQPRMPGQHTSGIVAQNLVNAVALASKLKQDEEERAALKAKQEAALRLTNAQVDLANSQQVENTAQTAQRNFDLEERRSTQPDRMSLVREQNKAALAKAKGDQRAAILEENKQRFLGALSGVSGTDTPFTPAEIAAIKKQASPQEKAWLAELEKQGLANDLTSAHTSYYERMPKAAGEAGKQNAALEEERIATIAKDLQAAYPDEFKNLSPAQAEARARVMARGFGKSGTGVGSKGVAADDNADSIVQGYWEVYQTLSPEKQKKTSFVAYVAKQQQFEGGNDNTLRAKVLEKAKALSGQSSSGKIGGGPTTTADPKTLKPNQRLVNGIIWEKGADGKIFPVK